MTVERTEINRVLIIEDEDANINDNVAIHVRVSSSENKENLARQRERDLKIIVLPKDIKLSVLLKKQVLA